MQWYMISATHHPEDYPNENLVDKITGNEPINTTPIRSRNDLAISFVAVLSSHYKRPVMHRDTIHYPLYHKAFPNLTFRDDKTK